MKEEEQIPRVLAYLERVEKRSVFTMPRSDWLSFGAASGSPVQIDVEQTPMGTVAQSASVMGAFAVKLSASAGQIHIYRWDHKDAPSPVNLDKYFVYEDLAAHNDYSKIVQAAPVNDNEELQTFLRNHVILVKEGKGRDHWLSALPGSAIAAISRDTGG